MLDAQYLWDIPDSVVAIWEELEDWAIADIIDRILKVEELNQTGIGGVARYRIELLQRMGMDMNDVLSEISQYTKKSEKELKELFLDAGTKSLENDAAVLLEHGIKTAMLSSNEWARQILQMMYDKTNGELRNFTGTFAQSYQKVLYECMDRAYVETATGMRTYTEAIGQAIEDLGRLGIKMIDYKGNHRDTVETVVRRAVLTGVNQASMRVCMENAKRLGAEYVIVSSHLGARVSDDKVSNHAGWQGKVYKIEGSDKIAPNLEEETGFPNNPLGLGGYNCRHNMFPWFPEMGDKNPFIQYGKAENEKAYEISQKQRAKERAIRKRKRELMALQKGIESTDDEKLKFELQQRYDKSAQKLQYQNKNYHEFCEENDVKTQHERMKQAKWDRTQARHASAGAQRYRNNLLTGKITYQPPDYIPSDWEKIKGEHTREDDIRNTNPKYEMTPSYQKNCAKCVPTYEMRRRGYNVEAQAFDNDNDEMFMDWTKAFENEIKIKCSGVNDIERIMEVWEDGSIAEVSIMFNNDSDIGHVFVAEKIDGVVRFLDPQTNEMDVSYYFTQAAEDSIIIARIDNLKPSKYIKMCCKKKEGDS